MQNSIEYLELLSEKYPSEASVCSEIININGVLALPKGTEHFISDLHGEFDAVRHILNNCSGVILEKVRLLFEATMGESRCRGLCSVIYYPHQGLDYLRQRGELDDFRLQEMLHCLRDIAELLSGKYTRGYVRRQMPEGHEFVLDELLHMQHDEGENQFHYHETIINSIISTGAADEVIFALSELIKRLAVDRLHVVGDIFDRGPHPERIIELLMDHPSMDIQWGNHDILWMGAAAGGAACISTVLRISLDYGNLAVLERGYGISVRPLFEFCEAVYGGSNQEQQRLALNVLGAKLEGQAIMRHQGFEMDDRLMLNYIDFEKGTIKLPQGEFKLNTSNFPTIDPADPYKLTQAEEALVSEYVLLFRESRALRRHMDFVFKRGSTYLCYNGNLLFHGCIPLTSDGEFAKVHYDGKWYSGRGLMDYADDTVSRAWAKKDKSALDMMWYLWCGTNSPFSGRTFHTFERAFVDDQITWSEPRNPYFNFWEDVSVVETMLEEFGLEPKSGHIINGHTPIKAGQGESPVKAGGRLFIIDGGFCKAYQPTTGIAGYTLIYNSHGIRLKSHRPFNGVAKVLAERADMESDSESVETFAHRKYIADTDDGAKLKNRTVALRGLLDAYRSGQIPAKG